MSKPVPFDLADPVWLAHRHYEPGDAIRFAHVPRAQRRAVPFLTDLYLGDDLHISDMPIAEALQQGNKAPLRWLFHSAFCASTLLAQAFDRPGISSALSEPVLLNDIVGLRRRGADRRAVARLTDCATGLLGRPFAGEQAVVVKPSNVLNPLAELLIAVQGGAPALFLHAPLPTFLVSVANKGLPCRLWARELAEGYLRDQFIDLGFAAADYFRMSDLQIAAVGWLAQHAHFARLGSKLGPAGLRSLDADTMLADPAAAIAAAAGHWGIALTDAEVRAIVDGPLFGQHSKSGAAYSAEARRDRYAAVRAAHADEIDTVLVWAECLADAAGLAMAAPNPLLAQSE